MTKSHNMDDWLVEFDIPPGGQPDMSGGQVPGVGMGTGPGGFSDPNITNVPNQSMQSDNPDPNQPKPNQPDQMDQDITNDPSHPDMPEEKDDVDFETWRNRYFKELLKGDSNHLIDLIHQVRDRDLDPYQRRFVEDNLQIQFLRQDSNIDKASREVVKNIKKQIDKNHPGVSLVNHLAMAIEANPGLIDIFIKCGGLWGAKGDIHRKFLASLYNAAQVGSGGTENEDIVYNDTDFSVQISTRFNASFGNVVLGSWALREDDPERYLEAPELKRLQNGSPEEKDVQRRRVVLESIVNKFTSRAFIINVINSEGVVHLLGIDLAEMLKSSYQDGKLVVRTKESENSEAMIDDDGKILPFIDLYIKYVQPTGQQTEEGKPEVEELDFLERKAGQLFLTGDLPTVKDSSTTLQGVVLKEFPYRGNPSDLQQLVRCVPSVSEIITRRC